MNVILLFTFLALLNLLFAYWNRRNVIGLLNLVGFVAACIAVVDELIDKLS